MIKQLNRINQKHRCCGAGPTIAKVDQIGDTLVVDAFEAMNEVVAAGAVMFQDPVSWPRVVEVIKEWHFMIAIHEHDGYISANQQSYQEAFWRTLLNDSMMGSEKKENQTQNSSVVRTGFRRLKTCDIASIVEGWWYWAQYISAGSKNKHGETEAPERALDYKFIRTISESFTMATALQTFVMKAGRMGIGPPAVCPGDAIIIMLVGSTPFCIKNNGAESSQNSTLVGDVYVHGLMDGEGVPENWQEKTIQIALT